MILAEVPTPVIIVAQSNDGTVASLHVMLYRSEGQ